MNRNKFFFQFIFVLLSCSVAFNFTLFAQSTPDPGLAGTYTVAKDTFDLGDLAFKPDSFATNVELRGSVHYPSTLVGGPFPVIVLLHGRHSTVFKTGFPGTVGLSWPPPTGYQSITSFEGYDYFARTMASHGYIVISISCNGINATDASRADAGMNARGQLVQKHLDLWNAYNTVGGAPFGSKFVGKLDMTRIGTMGHSRGGEGVIFNALLNKSLGSPYGIKAVLTLAPVDFQRKVMNNIPLMNIAPYCDGDVTNLQGVHFYDDARYNDTSDETPKHTLLIMGANHNFFNTVWTPGSYIAGGSDDWGSTSDGFCSANKTGNGRLDTTTQKAAFNAYAAAFFRVYVGGDTTFAPILNVDDIIPPVSSKLDTTQAYMSYHPGKSKRVDINRTDKLTCLTTNTILGTVTQASLVSSSICSGGLTIPNCITTATNTQEPHRGTASLKGLAQMSLRWNDTLGYLQNEIPTANQNVTKYLNVMFRTSVNYKVTKFNQDLDFTVQLVDSLGNTSNQTVNNNSGTLFYQPGSQPSVLPKVMMNTVKIPLMKFKGINQTKLKYIRFVFNKLDSGSVFVSELALAGIDAKPCGVVSAKFGDSLGKAYLVKFLDSSIVNSGDSIAWSWKFGDPASGIKDTSSLKNPTHVFSGSGAYKVCLYVSSYRTNGLICADTICKTITLAPNGIHEQSLDYITIAPNPANDFLVVNGAMPTDILELKNMFGQTLFSINVTEPTILLPNSLAGGIYFAVIHTNRGDKIQKLVLMR